MQAFSLKDILQVIARARLSFIGWVASLAVLTAILPGALNLDAFRKLYGPYIGVVFLVCFIAWLVEIAIMIWKKYAKSRQEQKKQTDTLRYLNTLNSREAHLLAVAIAKGIQTTSWRSDGDEVSSLVSKKLLIRVPDQNEFGNKPYTIPSFVWTEINKERIAEQIIAKDKEA